MNNRTRMTATSMALATTMLLGQGATLASAGKGTQSAPGTTACEALHVIGVHGLNEDPYDSRDKGKPPNHNMGPTLGGPGGFYQRLSKNLPSGLTVYPDGVRYPKSTIQQILTLNASDEQRIAKRVIGGAQKLDGMIKGIVNSKPNGCAPDQYDIVVAGYSEGAWVTDYFVTHYPKEAQKLEAIVLFGDPQYRPCLSPSPQGDCITTVGVDFINSISGPFSQGIARDLLADLFAYGADIPHYLPIPFSPATEEDYPYQLWNHTRSYCLHTGLVGPLAANDPICDFSSTYLDPNSDFFGKVDKLHVKGYAKYGIFNEAVNFLTSIL